MPQANSNLPKRITLVWGRDRLEVDEPIWIAKIVQSMAKDRQPIEEVKVDLSWPRSRRDERIHADLVAMGLHPGHEDPDAAKAEIGYQPPEHQDGVAVEALRAFLGLQMPVALNFTSYSGRSEHRMSAVDTFFEPGWMHYSKPDELEFHWAFRGYQLYASHHIGQAQRRPYRTDGAMGHIERRLLNGQWIRWGFDGASTPPLGRRWSSDRRLFILAPSGIQRIGQSDSDLWPECSDNEFDNDVEEGMSPSQEAT
jgi:hypothetical protein